MYENKPPFVQSMVFVSVCLLWGKGNGESTIQVLTDQVLVSQTWTPWDFHEYLYTNYIIRIIRYNLSLKSP